MRKRFAIFSNPQYIWDRSNMYPMQVFDTMEGLMMGAKNAADHYAAYRARRADDSREARWEAYSGSLENRVRQLEQENAAIRENLRVTTDIWLRGL